MVGVEGVFLESFVAGVVILAMLVAAVAYGSLPGERAHPRTEARPLKKAA